MLDFADVGLVAHLLDCLGAGGDGEQLIGAALADPGGLIACSDMRLDPADERRLR